MTSAALDAFVSKLPFVPDRFQIEALDAIDDGMSVVVTAPTGAGKTLVADGAIAVSIAAGSRAFYTTPIKALSNQKFNDLVAEYGANTVGLLTGDTVINGDAPIVVMTTEVLRNMIYEASSALDNLAMVILDEVHYLADRHRGAVWEEIIIHLPAHIGIVCLSATIANPEEFSQWIGERRGQCALVVETERPVPLTSMYMWRDRNRGGEVAMAPLFGRDGHPNRAIKKLFRASANRRGRFSAPRGIEVVRHLAEEEHLPCIYFVFSRKGCDQRAHEIAHAGFELTSRAERAQIRSIVSRRVAHLETGDLTVLGFDRWLTILEHGVAAHHAGLIPAFKETVEELFIRGLVKVVTATETLALGINMPARTVVLDSLSKFNGETHELLTPGDFTQLTGRAGRRGIDTEGTAAVLFSSYIPFDTVAAIAAEGARPLRSSFSPTYNMAVNLISKYDSDRAHELLDASFANFATGHRLSQLRRNLDDRTRDLETFRDAATCDRGDIWELDNSGSSASRRQVDTRLLEPGVVLRIGGESLVLLGRSWGGEQPKLSLTNTAGGKRTIRTRDLPQDTELLGTIALPTPVRSLDRDYRREIGSQIGAFVPVDEPMRLFPAMDTHGVRGCPDLETHLEWTDRARRTERDIRRVQRRIVRATTNDIAAEFDKLKGVLETMGYTNGWSLSDRGRSLRRIYSELDLLLVEALRGGIFDGLTAPEFGALASVFTYQARGGDVSEMPIVSFASAPVAAVEKLAVSIARREQRSGLTETRQPDVGLVDSIHAWASGLSLADIFDPDDLRAGDFVRSSRQLLDLLRQIRDGFPEFGTVTSDAIAAIDRGIVQVDGTR